MNKPDLTPHSEGFVDAATRVPGASVTVRPLRRLSARGRMVSVGAGQADVVRRRIAFTVQGDERSMELLLSLLRETWSGWVLRRLVARLLSAFVSSTMGEPVEYVVTAGEVRPQ